MIRHIPDVLEVHQHLGMWSPLKNVQMMHGLMVHLHRHGYRIAFLEPNPYFPSSSAEYTLVRNASC